MSHRHIDYWCYGTRMKSFREYSGDLLKIVLMSVPGLHVDQLPPPPLALPLTPRLWFSQMSRDPWRGPGLCSLLKHAQTGFANIPTPLPSAHTFRSFGAFSTVYWMESVLRALPSSTPISVLFQAASQHKLSTWVTQLVSPSLCPASAPYLKQELCSPLYLFPAQRPFPYPEGPILAEASLIPIRPRILSFLWRISSLHDLYLSFSA